MIYGESFEETNGMRSGWSTILEGNAQGTANLDPSTPFAASQRPSMKISYTTGGGGAGDNMSKALNATGSSVLKCYLFHMSPKSIVKN